MPETRSLSFSITGEAVTNIAREYFYIRNDLGKAIELLMACLQTDQLTDCEREGLALKIIDGRAELRGTYPGDDYGLFDLDEQDPRYSITNHVTQMDEKIHDLEEKLDLAYSKMAVMAENMDRYDKRNANADWHLEGHDDDIFTSDDIAPPPNLFGNTHDDDDEMSPMVRSYLDRMQDDRDDDYGWLEPDGTFHPVEYANHEQWAYETIKQRGWWNEYDMSDTSGIYAHGDFLVQKKGWVLLHNPGMGVAIVTKSDTKSLSKAQKEFLFDYYTKRNKTKDAAKYLED